MLPLFVEVPVELREKAEGLLTRFPSVYKKPNEEMTLVVEDALAEEFLRALFVE